MFWFWLNLLALFANLPTNTDCPLCPFWWGGFLRSVESPRLSLLKVAWHRTCMVPFFHVFPLDYRDNEWPDAVCTPQRCRIYLHQPCSRSTQAFPGCSSEIVTMSQTKFVGVLSGANKFGRWNRAVFHEWFEDLQILIDLICFLEISGASKRSQTCRQRDSCCQQRLLTTHSQEIDRGLSQIHEDLDLIQFANKSAIHFLE